MVLRWKESEELPGEPDLWLDYVHLSVINSKTTDFENNLREKYKVTSGAQVYSS